MWISPKLFLDQLNAWNLSEVGFRSGPQNFIRCYPIILFWFNSLIPPMNLRWLDWIFLGGYLPSLSINYVGMSKDMEKKLPQLYYIKMKISYDLGFIAIGVAMVT